MTIHQIFTLGLVAGFAIGAPYGPSGTLSLYRSVQYGWRIDSLTALGVSRQKTLDRTAWNLRDSYRISQPLFLRLIISRF